MSLRSMTRRLHALLLVVLALRRARIAHGAVSTETIVVDPTDSSVSLVDFRTASQGPTQERLDADLAGALAATGLVAGPERTAAAAAGCFRRRRSPPPCPISDGPASTVGLPHG